MAPDVDDSAVGTGMGGTLPPVAIVGDDPLPPPSPNACDVSFQPQSELVEFMICDEDTPYTSKGGVVRQTSVQASTCASTPESLPLYRTASPPEGFANHWASRCAPSSGQLVDISRVARHGVSLDVTNRFVSGRSLEDDFSMKQKPLGVGVDGAVNLAVRKRGTGMVAVKSLVKCGDVQKMSRRLREAEVHLSLDHPHIVRLERVVETREHIHLVMEHLSGGDLFDRLKTKGTFSEARAARVAQQTLAALAYLHGRGVSHRDIKLDNLVYESKSSDFLKVIDMGFSSHFDKHDPLTQRLGTPGYVAPEVWNRRYTEKVDLWSLGVALYMLLTNRVPLPKSRDKAVMAIATGRPFLHRHFLVLSPAAQSFIKCLLTMDQSRRPNATQALTHPWLQYFKKEVHMECIFFSSLRGLVQASCEKRALLDTLVWSFPSKHMHSWREQFLACCDESGVLTPLALRQAVWRSADTSQEVQSAMAAEIDGMFAAIDTRGFGEISFMTFAAAMLQDEYEDVFLQFADAPQGPLAQNSSAGHPNDTLLDMLEYASRQRTREARKMGSHGWYGNFLMCFRGCANFCCVSHGASLAAAVR